MYDAETIAARQLTLIQISASMLSLSVSPDIGISYTAVLLFNGPR